MRRDLLIKSGGLAGTSDFRVLAKIKTGLVPSIDAVTYKTRVKRVRLVRPGSSLALSHAAQPLLLVQAGERFGNRRVECPQQGEQLVADAVASERRVGIGRVLPPRLADGPEVCDHVFA